MASTIGIKTANGGFYPIFEEKSAVKKRLILTTVHNKQASVHIDLYKSDNQTITDDGYIGSLVVEHIKGKPSGEPSIELAISSNEAGEITAEAADLDAASKGEHQYLTVSLTSPEAEEREPQDFAIGEYEGAPPAGLYEPLNTGSIPWVRLILIVLCIIAVCFGVRFFLLSNFGSHSKPVQPAAAAPELPPALSEPAVSAEPEIPAVSDSPEEEVQEPVMPEPELESAEVTPEPEPEEAAAPDQAEPELEQPEVTAEPDQAEPVITARVLPESAVTLKHKPELAVSEAPAVPPAAAGPPVIEAPGASPPGQAALNRTRTRPPVASYKVPAAIPRGGVAYKIRWGDTLWDISEAFYRNPWLYQRIARFNKIRNSDLIISGRTIRIPPKR